MKKLVSLLSVFGLSVSSISSVVSCNSSLSYAGVDGQKVLVVSDSGPKNDKSFNQSSYEAMVAWADENKSDSSQDYTKNFIQPKSADASDIKQSLTQAKKFNPDALVLSGGTFSDTIQEASDSTTGKVLWVDGTSDQINGNNITNVIGISFKSELAGFEAGYASVDSFESLSNNKADVTLGTYGGGVGNLPYAVTNYMWGFALGAIYYGQKNSDSESLNSITVQTGKSSNIKWSKGDSGNVTQNGKIDGFTGNFDQASQESTEYASEYKDNDINFVVAGPQVADLLSKLDDGHYVVGVDVDQAAQYSDYSSHFLFSAGKDIKSAVKLGLENLSTLTQKDGSVGDESKMPWLTDENGNKVDNMICDTSWSKLLTSDSNKITDVSKYDLSSIIGSDKSDVITKAFTAAATSAGSDMIGLDSIVNVLGSL